MSETKNLNTQKFIEGIPESTTAGVGVKNYEVSSNLARDTSEIKRTRSYVIRNDGTNISTVINPHDLQIGLDPGFQSNLRVKGKVTIDGDLEVRGETTGIESGGTSGGKFVFQSRDSCRAAPGRLFPWYSSNSAIGGAGFGNIDSILTMPFAGTITAMSLHVKANSGAYSAVQKITVVFYKSQSHTTRSAEYTQETQLGGSSDIPGGEMEILIDNFDGSSGNLYYKSHGINISVNAGDVFQIQHQRVGGTDRDILFSITLVESSEGGGDPGP